MSQSLNFRMRADLDVQESWGQGDRCWILRDPVSGAYFQLFDEEFALLKMLDGVAGLGDIKRNFEERFAPAQLDGWRTQQLIHQWLRDELLVSLHPDQEEALLERAKKKEQRGWINAVTNVLAIRVPGVDPQPALTAAEPYLRWIFSGTFGLLMVSLWIAAGALALVNFAQIQQRLPDFEVFFAVNNLIALAAVMGAIKVVHELAHATTCQHYGARCREMGVLFLVFTPCLYCDVSDAWMLPSRWRRMMINAAGVYAELTLASLATIVWWSSQPGMINAMCLNIMVVCSVSTLLFNGNPLLRYDGYYLLADGLALPNLWSQSRGELKRFLAKWCLGLKLGEGAPVKSPWIRRFYRGYAAASLVYQAFMIYMIGWFLWRILQPMGLGALLWGAMLSLAAMAVVKRGAQLFTTLRQARDARQLKRWRIFVLGLIVVLLVGLLLQIPWRVKVTAPLILDTNNAEEVYVTEPGQLLESVAYGAKVKPGDVLARISNFETEQRVKELEQEEQRLTLLLEQLDTVRNQTDAAARRSAAQAELTAVQGQLSTMKQSQAALVLRAPRGGEVLPPSGGRRREEATEDELSGWSGLPLDRRNQHCHVSTGTALCRVGDGRPQQAVAYVNQADIPFVRAQQAVRIVLDQLPGRILTGVVSEVAEIDADSIPPQLLANGVIPAKPNAQGQLQPLETIYQARIDLQTVPPGAVLGGRGRCRIRAEYRTLAWRLKRLWNQTFRFGAGA